MANTKVGLTLKKTKDGKPKLEAMYMLEEAVKAESKLARLKRELQEDGYDLRDFTKKELVGMLRRGF